MFHLISRCGSICRAGVNRAALLDCGWRRAGALASAYDGATVFSSDLQERARKEEAGAFISSDRFTNVRAYMFQLISDLCIVNNN